ncbi:hypothetical protein EVAR_26941_1, partial [Eumeta japonica]
CLATISTVYWRSNEESVQGERHKGYARTREITTLEGSSRADRVQAAGRPGAAPPAVRPPILLAFCLLSVFAWTDLSPT